MIIDYVHKYGIKMLMGVMKFNELILSSPPPPQNFES